MAYNSKYSGEQVEGVLDSHLQMTEHDAVSNVPTPCRLAVCTIGEGGEFSLADVPQKGGEVTVIFKNTTDEDLSVDIPVGDVYVSLDGATSLTVPAGGCAGLRTVSDGVNVYTNVVSVSSSGGGGGGGSLTGEVGDILFYDSEKDTKTIVAFDDWSTSKDSYPASRYTPIGVVVIPSSHDVYGTGECAVMSLREMDYNNPDEGTNTNLYMYWGYNSSLLGNALDSCVQTGTCASPTSEASGAAANPYMPSDNFSGTQCPTDPEAYYNYTNTNAAAPSPYLEDGSRNPVYYQTESPATSANCLADFDGVGKTQLMLDAVTVSGWQTASTIANSYSAGNYPSACCCWRFNTAGTKQGDWYLPACGEAGYMVARRKKLDETITALIGEYGDTIGVAFVSGGYWSSSEYSSPYARRVHTNTGYVNYLTKYTNYYVRAFLRVGQLQSQSEAKLETLKAAGMQPVAPSKE